MWLYVPLTSCPSARASECTTLDSERCSMLARFVTSSGKHSPPRSWSVSWKRDAWIRRLSGLTLPPSTLDRGATSWISSLQDSPASRTQLPANERATRTSVRSVKVTDLSRTSSESSVSVAPPWSALRTSQLGLLGDGFGQLGSNYASWVTSSKIHSSSLRTTLAHRISANGSGSWPTSRAEDSESCGNHGDTPDSLNAVAGTWKTPHGLSSAEGGGGEFQKAVENWSTPRATEAKDVHYQYDRGDHSKPRLSLTGEASQWMTPNVPNGGRKLALDLVAMKGTGPDGIKRQVGLENQIESWASPTARMYKGGSPTSETRKDGKSRLDQLDYQTENFSRQVHSTLDGTELSRTSHTLRRRLNPAFACWLMGLAGWWTNPAVTSSVRSAMAEYRSALRLHGQRLLGES